MSHSTQNRGHFGDVQSRDTLLSYVT